MKRLMLLVIILGTFSLQAAVKELTTETFAENTKQGFVVVDFFTDWCGPCKSFAPTYSAASDEMAGKVIFGKVNATRDQRLLDKYRVDGFPTIILFKDGKEVKRFVGSKQKPDLMRWLQQAAG